ncbi:hypothetical protein OLX02_02110 [Novosphingobium sp. KCTC 2891]|uniref:hypothetical protein n=1 Tax=Novosphingobium sp. KCTC 2891 TaxID=2989730 RepID=UPI0022239DE4|nr:hypothetical protein [Novosphingobium sp. KCTC 2891]MCW1381608.1 hypothetical protein [Novosphingobium sp. KCTC 2891]
MKPSPSQTLAAAALEQGATNATSKPLFVMPTAVNATNAFGTKILPPEADKGGKYVKGGLFSRSVPADWYEALYSGESTLANPAVGYPITGTTQFVSGTCFADPAVRNALVTFLTTTLGNTKFDATGAKISADMFTGVKTGKLGLRAQMGIAPLPKAWKVAVTESFLVRSKQKDSAGNLLADRNLYIQNGVPSKVLAKALGKALPATFVTADLPTTVNLSVTLAGKTKAYTNVEAGPNSACTIGSGL